MGKLIEVPFCGQTYKSESTFMSNQECVNFYLRPWPELGENKYALLGTPGLELWVDFSTPAVIRGMLVWKNLLYVVVGSKFYSVDKSGAYELLGNINSTSGPVGMACNGVDLMIVDGGGYIWDLVTKTLTQITDSDFPGAYQVIEVDGYYLVPKPGTGQVWRSDLNDGLSWGGLAFSTAGGDPDDLVSILADHRDVYLYGKNSLEIWYNTGAETFNFSRIEGAFAEVGTVGSHSVCKANNAVYCLGQDKNGHGQLLQSLGRQPKAITTFPISRILGTYTDLSDANIFAYQQNDHTFVVINVHEQTWVYDTTVGMWHQRSTRINGKDGRWRGDNHGFAFGYHIIGDYSSGKLYKLKPDVYTDASGDMISVRTSPIIRSKQELITVNRFQLIMEPAVGLITGNDQDVDPKAIISWSRDGGKSWIDEEVSMGKIGEYDNTVEVYQLGQGRNWVFKVAISAAVKRVILGAVAEVEIDD